MKYYLDTCIWIDYFENREDRFRPLGDWALRLINKIMKEESVFVVSNVVIDELLTQYLPEKVTEILSIVPIELREEIEISEVQVSEAVRIKKSKKIPLGDAMHAVLARDIGCILVTRDLHLEELDFVDTRRPEDLI